MVAKQEHETDKKHERHKQQEEHVEFRRAIGKISLTQKCKETFEMHRFNSRSYILLHQTVAIVEKTNIILQAHEETTIIYNWIIILTELFL